MDFTYYLPGPNNTRIEYNTSSNSVIIIGANGSGKSKLGAWIEKNYAQNTHRIAAIIRIWDVHQTDELRTSNQ